MADLNRDEVVRKMRAANTLEKVAEAEEAIAAWLREHPDDVQIRFGQRGWK